MFFQNYKVYNRTKEEQYLVMTRETKTILTREECAERLNISVRTLDRWRYTGEGPAFLKMNRTVRYEESDIENFLHSKKNIMEV